MKMRDYFLGLVMAMGAVGACASSEDEGGGGSGGGGTGGSGAADGSAGSAGTGASGFGGSGGTGATGGSGGTAATGATGGASGGAAGGGGSAAQPADAGPPVNVTGRLRTLTGGGLPIADVKVCVYQVPSVNCVMSDSNGDYTVIGAPGNSEILLEYTKATFYPSLVTVRTQATNLSVGTFLYPSETEANLFAQLVGKTIDKTKAQVVFTALQTVDGGTDGQDGVMGTMTPASGSGPYYVTDANPPIPNTGLNATTTNGLGLWANVNPGEIEIDMVHGTKTCAISETSWVGSKTTAAKALAVAGYLIGGPALLCP